jgi:two-component system sensor histidine kinase DegS
LASIALENAELYSAVKSFNKNLEQQVQERTSELVQAREQIAQKAEEVEWLLSKTVHIQEEERARIARDLHDGVDQLIVGAIYELQTAKAGLDSQRPETAQEKIAEVRELLQQVEQEIRRVIYDLRPTYLDAGDLDAALRKYAASFQDLAGISCVVETIGDPLRLPAPIEVIIFRIGQEALHNVMKHAHATLVRVRLEFKSRDLTMQVEDNGRGFTPNEQSDPLSASGLGLRNIRDRAHAIGGAVEVESKPQQGTRITFRLPLSAGFRNPNSRKSQS